MKLKLVLTLLITLFLASGTYAQFTTTPNVALKKPNANLATGWDVYLNGDFDIIDSAIGINAVLSCGVVGDGTTDDTAALQACYNGFPSTGGTLVIPAGLNIKLTAAGGAPISVPSGIRTICAGMSGWGAPVETNSTVHFQTADAVLLFKIGTIGASTVRAVGAQFENCAFRDVSGSNNTALGAIGIYNTNRSMFRRLTFADFNRPPIATPAAPAISGSGAGAVSFWVKITCINDAMGETVAGAEQTLASNTNPLTVTAPTSTGCPAPSSGYRVWATTTGTGVEVLQAAAGCTLNASGTGCGLSNNWSGTVSNAGGALIPYDTSAGFGAQTNANAGANGTATDASYDEWEQMYCRNTQECFQFNGGSQFMHGGGELSGQKYDILNQVSGFVSIVGGPSLEANDNVGFRMVIAASSSPTTVIGSKFEGHVAVPNNETCVEVNSSRNTFLGNSWTKCNVIVQQNAGSVANLFDFMNQVSNGTTHATGITADDTILDNLSNGGNGTQFKLMTAEQIRATPVVFSALPGCAAGTEGQQEAVTNSTTNTWGATITGGGTNHVLAYCDGTVWTVAAK